jgi:hypothetical protein
MDAKHFDSLTKFIFSTSASSTRRGLLRLLPTLPVAGALTTLVASLGERTAAHPVERVQKRRDKHRHRARRRQDNHHDRRTRDNGQGGEAGVGERDWNGCTPLENLCVAIGRECCPNTECVKIFPLAKQSPGTCQSRSCTTTAECAARFPSRT